MEQFKDFHFKGQAEGEQIIRVIRRHWFNILQQYFVVFGMIALLFVGFWLIPAYYNLDNPEYFKLFLFGESTFAIIIWIFAFIIWIDYYFDVWIITNQRVVNIEQKALFVRSISELKFSKIQDVSIQVNGIIPTVLNYGDLFIQTAGSKNLFLFHQVPNPHKLKTLVMNMQNLTANSETESSPFNV